MWNHFCSSFFVGGRKSGDKGKQYDRAGFEGNEKTVQPRCARELHSFLSLRERMRHPCSEAGFFDSDGYY